MIRSEWKCRECGEMRRADDFRLMDKNGFVYRRKVCRKCEAKTQRGRFVPRETNIPDWHRELRTSHETA